MAKLAIGLDVYGTLVDPIEIHQQLRKTVGEKARLFAQIWRQKQLEYTFRRGLMDCYQNFDVCTQQALRYTAQYLGIRLSALEKAELLDLYEDLQPFSDVVPALKILKQKRHTLVAFSNGVRATLKTLLTNAKILYYLEDIVSVDELHTFKPSPKAYEFLAAKTASDLDSCWVVSSNAFDVIGAKSSGLNAAWIQRDTNNILDPWECSPTLTVKNLMQFANQVQ